MNKIERCIRFITSSLDFSTEMRSRTAVSLIIQLPNLQLPNVLSNRPTTVVAWSPEPLDGGTNVGPQEHRVADLHVSGRVAPRVYPSFKFMHLSFSWL